MGDKINRGENFQRLFVCTIGHNKSNFTLVHGWLSMAFRLFRTVLFNSLARMCGSRVVRQSPLTMMHFVTDRFNTFLCYFACLLENSTQQTHSSKCQNNFLVFFNVWFHEIFLPLILVLSVLLQSWFYVQCIISPKTLKKNFFRFL